MPRRSSVGRTTGLIGSWGTADVDDPRLLQVGFTVLIGLDYALRLQGGARFGPDTWPWWAALLLVVVTTTALVLPWRRLPASALGVLAVVDVLVIGACRLSPEGSGAAILIGLPALWLGRYGIPSGPLVCGAAALLFLATPSLIYFPTAGVAISRALLPAVVAVGVSIAKASATAMLSRQRQITQAVFDTVDVGLVLLDASGHYVTMNRRHQEFMSLGFPDGHDGHAGRLGEVYDVDGRTPMTREQMPTYRASQGEEFDDLRMWIGADLPTRRAISTSARAVRDDQGRLSGAALAYTDVTDLMKALAVKDDFVALVSHELRTPLTSIVGYLQLLEEDPDIPPQAVRQLGVVHRNAERLHGLIGDLLDTAQRDGRPMPIARGPADLAAIVVDSVEAARPVADTARVSLRLVAPEALPTRLDAQRIGQVVDNLVSNAIKYTEAGGDVGVVLASGGAHAVLEVHDTGIGISVADQERLFTRFFRTEDAARRAVAGAGLGLSITKDIVESHGGRIEVVSTPGEGSVFRVSLPLRPSDA